MLSPSYFRNNYVKKAVCNKRKSDQTIGRIGHTTKIFPFLTMNHLARDFRIVPIVYDNIEKPLWALGMQ